ncbi:coronatine-insensitive protein 1-like protein, partial [Tanacetum coccineum]
MEGSMESVLDCVVPYIHDGDDLNSISLVSRKHLTVHVFYASNPSTLSKRFPFIKSLTLKGLPNSDDVLTQTSATPWIKEISDKFECLKALHIRGLVVSDQDLELLAKTRGKGLRSLKICECQGFSEKGLVHISQYCNDLTSLCLEYDNMDGDHTGEWLRELALHNTPIESLHFRWLFNDLDDFDVEDLTLVARSCSNSLVSVKINPKPLNHLRDAFSHAIKLQDFDAVIFDKDGDYTSFKFPPSIRCL